METKELKSWSDFEGELEHLKQFRQDNKLALTSPAKLVFRGQSDARWPLETTLERAGLKKCSMIKYRKLIQEVRARIETETKKTWNTVNFLDYLDWLKSHDLLWSNGLPEQELEYLVYLRHHGFPSPLLDWSEDFNVAAYFAFRNIYSAAESVAIFVYLEHLGIKGYRGEDPSIKLINRDIPMEERHQSQHSVYTICATGEGETAHYSDHEDIFKGIHGHRNPQDRLWKFVIPANEQGNVIKQLNSKNINAYTLFKSEESLMETLFLGNLFK